jgi:hypothetical protein
MAKRLRTTLILSWLIAVFYLFPAPLLSIIRNAVSYITVPGFREHNWPVSLDSLLTLIVGLLFISCIVNLKRGSYRARLIWLGFLAYFIYSCAPFLLSLNLQRIVVFLLSIYCLIMELRTPASEETRAPEIGNGLRRITEGFLWLSVLSICLEWSLVFARVIVAIHYKVATIINAIVSLSVVVPLLIYTAVLLHNKRGTAPAAATVLLLAAGLAGFVTNHYVPAFYYLRSSYDGPLTYTTDTLTYPFLLFKLPILIAYIVYHVICLVLAGVFLSRFKRRLPTEH